MTCRVLAMADCSRAVVQQVFSAHCPPHDALQLQLRSPPSASPGHVVVRMTVSVVNPVDILFISQSKLSAFRDFCAVPGSEGVGIVHQVGEGVTAFRVGERVVPVIYWDYMLGKGQGAWQDFIEVAERDLIRLPDSISDEAASQFVINPWTVYGLLSDLAIPKGEYLLQTAGSSVLGRLVIQLAKHWGIRTINVVRREGLKDELVALGAYEVINGMNEDVVSKVLKVTEGRGAYAGIDSLAGASTKVVAASVRDGGDVFVYGMISSSDVMVSAYDLMRKVHVTYWNLTRFLKDEEKKRKLMECMPMLFEKKILTPLVGKKFSLLQIKEAILEAQKSAKGGKVLLTHDSLVLE